MEICFFCRGHDRLLNMCKYVYSRCLQSVGWFTRIYLLCCMLMFLIIQSNNLNICCVLYADISLIFSAIICSLVILLKVFSFYFFYLHSWWISYHLLYDLQPYAPGYTAPPPRANSDETTIDIRHVDPLYDTPFSVFIDLKCRCANFRWS